MKFNYPHKTEQEVEDNIELLILDVCRDVGFIPTGEAADLADALAQEFFYLGLHIGRTEKR